MFCFLLLLLLIYLFIYELVLIFAIDKGTFLFLGIMVALKRAVCFDAEILINRRNRTEYVPVASEHRQRPLL